MFPDISDWMCGMTRERIQEYTRRITNASSTELVVIMYDIVLADMDIAKKAIDSGNKDEFHAELKDANRFMTELMGSLDFKIPVSYNLMSLYMYVHRTIVKADAGCKKELLDSAADVLEKLREAFAQLSAQDKNGPMISNAQQVYAGLTYGKGALNEMILDAAESKRGFYA